jgi:hypothetical protein
MAIRSKQDQLDLGVPIEAPNPDTSDPNYDPDVSAYTDAFYTTVLGRRATPTKFGTYLARVSSIVPAFVVVADTAKAALPGPILNVQATAGFKTGQMAIILSGAPASGEVLLTVDPVDGRDILTFDPGDAVTLIHYRQLGMPAEIFDELVADTEPPIED